MIEPNHAPAEQRRLEELTELARHARRRLGLYRARVHGPKPTSPDRLAQLQRDAERAEAMAGRAHSHA